MQAAFITVASKELINGGLKDHAELVQALDVVIRSLIKLVCCSFLISLLWRTRREHEKKIVLTLFYFLRQIAE